MSSREHAEAQQTKALPRFRNIRFAFADSSKPGVGDGFARRAHWRFVAFCNIDLNAALCATYAAEFFEGAENRVAFCSIL